MGGRGWVVRIVLTLAAVAWLGGCAGLGGAAAPRRPAPVPPLSPADAAGPGGLLPARVTRVVDGDTIHVSIAGRGARRREKVRFIGVDAPETTKRAAPYGREAARFTARRLAGRTVYLELDMDERDRYGRLLAYVWLEPPRRRDEAEVRGRMFNAVLLLEGYARLLTVPPDVRYADRFAAYQREAREARRGLWR